MNKMEILKEAFEKVGYRIRIEKSNQIYLFFIEGTEDGDGNEYILQFNENFEPLEYSYDRDKLIPINQVYEEIDERKKEWSL